MTTIYTNKDTLIRETYPNDSHGTDLVVWASGSVVNRLRGLFAFDISSIDVATVTVATLYLYAYSKSDGVHTGKRITSSWAESVTWNTEPTTTDTNSANITITSLGWSSVNVLAMLQDETGSEFGIEFFTADGVGSTGWRSKEYDSGSVKAYLSITGGGITGDKYVDIATGSDSDSGNTWASAYLTVKKGIDNLPANNNLHIAEGDYSAQVAIDLNQNINLICEDYGGGNASPPLTVTLPVTT